MTPEEVGASNAEGLSQCSSSVTRKGEVGSRDFHRLI